MIRKHAVIFSFVFFLFIVGSCDFFGPEPIPGSDTEDPGNQIPEKVELTAGPAQSAAYNETEATVTFNGATGLTLTTADFTVTPKEETTISTVSVSGDTVSVTVTFTANDTETAKTYTVGIAADSAKIKGDATVVITQAAVDPRKALTPGETKEVPYTATEATVLFIGATGLDLTAADFTVTPGGATISNVLVSGDTVSVKVTFAANENRIYTVGINPSSEKIKASGTGTVPIIQGTDPRPALTAGAAVSVEYTAATATVTFTGATGLTLAAADFTVTPKTTISRVSVSSGEVSVTVSIGENTTNEPKTYTVKIAQNSAKIKGNAAVVITQATDSRKELTAGPDVNADQGAATATATFTGATGLTLAAADFTVTPETTISSVRIDSGEVFVTVSIGANTANEPKTYTVKIAQNSAKIKGAATVVITQAAKDPRVELTAGLAQSAAQSATSANVTFTGATGLTLAVADFTVTTGGTIGIVLVGSDGTVIVPVSFAANTTNAAKEYTVGIASTSEKIKGGATIKITQATYPVFVRPSPPVAYTLVKYEPYATGPGIAELKTSGSSTTYLVTNEGLKNLFNAIYTPNAPDTTDSVVLDGEAGYPKTAVTYTADISEKVLGLFKITIGSTADNDTVELTGTELPATSDASPAASTTNLIIIDIGLPDGPDNSGLPTFYIPVPDASRNITGLGELGGTTTDYSHIRLRVNKGAELVILANNDNYISSNVSGKSCPTGDFNGGCVEVMAGGKLRDGAYEGFPLGADAVILNRLHSYLAIGPEPDSDDATTTTGNTNLAYNAYYKGWLIGPDAAGEAKPRIKWDSGNNPSDYLEVREGKLALSANVTVQISLGLIYSAWFIDDTTVTIEIPDEDAAKTSYGGRGLFANGLFMFYGTTDQARIILKRGCRLDKLFLEGASGYQQWIPNNGASDVVITNDDNFDSKAGEQYVGGITGKAAWTGY